MKPVVVLAGGIGAARFLRGLVQVVPPSELVVIGNTGDDIWWHGLYISPDLDTVTYWLAGIADYERGWGIRGDTFHMQKSLERLTHEAWFQLGDQDLATHIYRSSRLRHGAQLHQITQELALRHGVAARLIPMSNDPVTTRLKTDQGDLHFQEYFVREAARPAVREIYWTGLDAAVPAPGVLEAIEDARAILIAPSNPIISIGPILHMRGIREKLAAAPGRTVAVSPLVGGRAVKGPTVELMRVQGIRQDAVGVAQLYRELAAGFVLDSVDDGLVEEVKALGYRVIAMPTLMDELEMARALAARTLELAEVNPLAA
jgi:LPPG:FO 2-phospho-L-lactate transferase